jgi:acyl-[acyl-carrier-protein]-phospholipid O-acyltransferase / long-chain-fatty-acid--[acyl-carrier-protein] ligase
MSVVTAPVASSARDLEPDRALAPLPKAWTSLARAFVHSARSRPSAPCLVDSTGTKLSYGETFLRASALAKVLSRSIGPALHVGVMVPPTVHGALVNLALTLLGKVPVNLNYTASQAIVDSSIDQCGITHVLTSGRVLDKFKITPKGERILLEDLPKQVKTTDKVFAALVAKVVPGAALGAFLPGLRRPMLDDPATVIFTSGSTGDPKGVVLSHRNVLSNIHQFKQQVQLSNDEVILGVLPFFHSFGFTVTIWGVYCLGFKGVYHFSPLDARVIGNLCQEHKATILLCTPTFFQGYLKRCEPAQFATMRLPILGAEKLKPEVAQQIRDALGIEPLEGYGCTELSPVVAVNTPNPQTTRDGREVPGNRPGTVGMPVPGTAIKTVDPETGAELLRGVEGLIHVKGPQVMVGYLNRPEATAKAVQGGWYATGDLGHLDSDGFLWITGRLSRFSKIAGEMVPHEGVEAALIEAASLKDLDAPAVAVTAIPDPKRQERLIVVHTEGLRSPAEVCRILAAGPLPKLWLPSPDDFMLVASIPVLGSGKLDLRALRTLAEERFAGPK